MLNYTQISPWYAMKFLINDFSIELKVSKKWVSKHTNTFTLGGESIHPWRHENPPLVLFVLQNQFYFCYTLAMKKNGRDRDKNEER